MKELPHVPHGMNCNTCTSRVDSVFCELSQGKLESLNQAKTTNHYKRGQIIFYEGNPPAGLFCVTSGKIKLQKNGSDGAEVIVRISGPGDILGIRSLLTDQTYNATAEVIEDADVCFIDQKFIANLIKEDSSLAMNVIRKLGSELAVAQDHLTEVLNNPVRQRLSHLLLTLSKTYGKPTSTGTFIDVKLSRAEMGSMIGSTPETVIRLLSDFNDMGIVVLNGKKIFIKDPNALAGEANLEN